MTEIRIFLDANVIFSAAIPDSHLNRLVRYLADTHTPSPSSDYAREEAFRNICAKRPDWLNGYHHLLSGLEIVRSVDRSVEVEIAAKDRPILATAIHEACEYLVTGDKRDYGALCGRDVAGTKVVTPLTLVETLEGRAS